MEVPLMRRVLLLGLRGGPARWWPLMPSAGGAGVRLHTLLSSSRSSAGWMSAAVVSDNLPRHLLGPCRRLHSCEDHHRRTLQLLSVVPPFPRPARVLSTTTSTGELMTATTTTGQAESSSRNNNNLEVMLAQCRDLVSQGNHHQAALLAVALLHQQLSTFTDTEPREMSSHQQEEKLTLLDDHVRYYPHLVEVLAASGRLDKALYLLHLMNAQGIKPNLTALTAVVAAANHVDTIAFAEAIYDQLVDEGEEVDMPFYDAFINSLVSAGKFRRAHQIYFHSVKRQSKRWKLVKRIFKWMNKCGVLPGNEHFCAAVLANAKSNGIDDAFTFVETSPLVAAARSSEDLYNTLIEACALHYGTVDKSWRALRLLKNAGFKPSTRTYNRILAGYAKFGRVQEIDNVLDKMAQDGVSKDGDTFSFMIQAHTAAPSGNLLMTQAIFQEYKKLGFAPRRDIYESLFGQLSQVAEHSEETVEAINKAEALLSDMKAAGVPANVTIFTHLIKTHYSAHNVERALALYKDMKRSGIKPNSDLVQLLGSLVEDELSQLVVNGQL